MKQSVLNSAFYFALMLIAFNASAQIQPTNLAPFDTPSFLINNVLMGSSVSTSNIKYQGSTVQIGYFKGGKTGNVQIGIDSGIVLSTGDISSIPDIQTNKSGKNIQGQYNFPFDSDMISLVDFNSAASGRANDASILEFDFVATSDSIKFDYVFASDEYGYLGNNACKSLYNDAFGIFLSGSDISGTYNNNAINIATVPYTNPAISVSTHNVSNSKDSCIANNWANLNDSLLIKNNGGSDFIFDAFTKVFTAKHAVKIGSKYHLKFAISDDRDNGNDAAVFIKASSIASKSLSVTQTSSSGILGDSSIVEGCTSGNFTFYRPGFGIDTLVVKCDYSKPIPFGTKATMGIDYSSLPDSIVFLPGVTKVVLPVTATQDNISEGIEGLSLTIKTTNPKGDIVSITNYMYIVNPLQTKVSLSDISICTSDTATLIAHVTGGYAPYSFSWSTGDTTSSIKFKPTLTTDVWVTVLAKCINSLGKDTAKISLIESNPISIIKFFSNDTVVESCGDTINFKFSIAKPAKSTYSVGLEIYSGINSAKNGIDYGTNNNKPFPNSISFNVGDTVVSVPLIIKPDTLKEFREVILIGINQASLCGNLAPPQVPIYILQSKGLTITATDDTICVGKSVILTANGASSYVWNNGVSNAISFTPTKTNKYSVTGNVGGLCIGKDSVKVVVDDCTSIKENASNSELKIYPNPAHSAISLINLPKSNAIITIISTLGEVVLTKQTKGFDAINFDVANFNPGLYFITVSNKSYKFIKQ